MKNVKFLNYDCKVELNRYRQSNRLSISLVSAVSNPDKDLFEGEPIATATVNIPEEDIGENQVMIKDYSENTGMTKALEEAGLIVFNQNTKSFGIGSGSVVIADMSEELIQQVKNDQSLALPQQTKKLKR
ncbi:hypothetical protein GW796_10890 [archaeon]|nr:hypothetical protein [archaeon]